MSYVLAIGEFHEFYKKLETVLLNWRNHLVETAVTEKEKEWEKFTVGKSYLRRLDRKDMPAVILYPPSISPVSGKSAVGKYMQYRADYIIDLVAGEEANSNNPADRNTVERLLYLIKQVLDGFYGLSQVTFGTVGSIGIKTYPSFTTLVPSAEESERPVVASQMSFTLELGYQPPTFPSDIVEYVHRTPVPLEEIFVDGGKIKAEYEFEQE
jgi:hypothetical protein